MYGLFTQCLTRRRQRLAENSVTVVIPEELETVSLLPCGFVGHRTIPTSTPETGAGYETEAEATEEHCCCLTLHVLLSLLSYRNTHAGSAPPTAGRNVPYQLSVMKMPPQACLQASLMGAFSQQRFSLLFPDDSRLCQIGKALVSTMWNKNSFIRYF